ncbi:MAG TPA: SCO family protein [Nitrolancea sp.]|jgi:protein SCO1/2|nr:SCO family protein [Nitrolancea sp.]
MHWKRRTTLMVAIAALLVILAGGGAWAAGLVPFGDRGAAIHGSAFDPNTPAPNFTLEEAGNKQVQLNDFRGKVVLLYFGYTYCPDICPTTLATIARARASLGADASKVQFVMVTVDPKRDTPARLDAYVQKFDPSFVGLSGTLAQITPIASEYGIYFQAQSPDSTGGYSVDHTAAVTLIDPQGQRRLLESYGTTSDQFATDIRSLLH